VMPLGWPAGVPDSIGRRAGKAAGRADFWLRRMAGRHQPIG
jgi:hypothetical protein